MKILITENQLEKIIKKYITSYMKDSVVTHDRDFVYWRTKSGHNILSVSFYGSYFITLPFSKEIRNIFSIGMEASHEIIGEWGTEQMIELKKKWKLKDEDINY